MWEKERSWEIVSNRRDILSCGVDWREAPDCGAKIGKISPAETESTEPDPEKNGFSAFPGHIQC